MSQSQSDCLKSAQYRVIQNLYDKLVEAVSPEIDVVLAKAWSKNVIGKQQLDTSLELSSSTHRKATVFISGIASRIKVDSSAFEVFLSLLKEVPSLHYIVELLESELRSEITGIVGDRSQSISSHLSSSVITLEPLDETASEEVDDPTVSSSTLINDFLPHISKPLITVYGIVSLFRDHFFKTGGMIVLLDFLKILILKWSCSHCLMKHQ